MNARRFVFAICCAAAAAGLILASPDATLAGRGNGPVGVIYVQSQDLYYETIGLTELPPDEGPFQVLFVDLDDDGNIVNAETEYGPGDPGYVGGRWEALIFDADGCLVNVRYFECPLLGPGNETP